jgi:hypothetical protein
MTAWSGKPRGRRILLTRSALSLPLLPSMLLSRAALCWASPRASCCPCQALRPPPAAAAASRRARSSLSPAPAPPTTPRSTRTATGSRLRAATARCSCWTGPAGSVLPDTGCAAFPGATASQAGEAKARRRQLQNGAGGGVVAPPPWQLWLLPCASGLFARPPRSATIALPLPVQQSYYGAALCCCWSPDGRFVASGGEDDLVTVYSVPDKQVGRERQKAWRRVLRAFQAKVPCATVYLLHALPAPPPQVVAFGEGHSSFVSRVGFDPWACSDGSGGGEQGGGSGGGGVTERTYRLGSAGQDTALCLWDLVVEEDPAVFNQQTGQAGIK